MNDKQGGMVNTGKFGGNNSGQLNLNNSMNSNSGNKNRRIKTTNNAT